MFDFYTGLPHMVHKYFINDSKRLVCIWETARSPEQLKSKYWSVIPRSLPQWMVFMHISVQYKLSVFAQWKFVWQKIKMAITSAYIEYTTGNGNKYI